MEQAKALSALEPFLALTKSATTPRQAADLIVRATSAPNTYLFAELLASPQIQALSSSAEHGSHLALLQIFATGTWASYVSAPNLPELNEAQTVKLRLLSLLTLAETRTLAYPDLIRELGMDNARQLEGCVVGAVYAGLVKATLDPAAQTVNIHSVAPLRDVDPGSVPALLGSLSAWSARCDEALRDLEKRVRAVRARAAVRARESQEWEVRVSRIRIVEGEGHAKAGGGGGAFGGFGDPGSQGLPARRSEGGHGQGGGGGGRSSVRYGKRGSGHMDSGAGGGEVDDEAMDLDEEDSEVGDGKKRTSRRKLQD